VIKGATQAVQFPNVGTTASAANAFLDNASSNNLLRSTSSIRFKRDVLDLTDSEADAIVLRARPIKYRSICKADDPDLEHVGLIAEEIDAIDRRLVTRTHDGLGGVQYDRFVAPLLSVMRRQQARLAAPETRMT
jgi:hypothetical protein